jgi:hypothetical protein
MFQDALHCCAAVAAAAFVRNEPPPEQNDAHWLLDFYSSFMSCSPQDTTDRALECLAKVPGLLVLSGLRRRGCIG